MAKLMKAVAWKKLERPYTRKSKYRQKAYVRSVPTNKVIKFVMGSERKEFDLKVYLKSTQDIQIRHNALEAARKTANKHLETKAVGAYFLKLRVYPHHVLRNNPLAAGAGADRMSTGMAHSFGKAVGIAARIKKDQVVFEARVNKDKLDVAKEALNRAKRKMPCSFTLVVESASKKKA